MRNSKKRLKPIRIKKSAINKLAAFFLIINAVMLYLSPAYGIITDDFVLDSLDKNLEIKSYKPKVYRDEFVEGIKIKPERKSRFKVKTYRDEFAESNKRISKHSIRPVVITESSFSDNNTVEIKILNPLSTKSKTEEGNSIDFVTTKDVRVGNVLYPAGTLVKARIETVSQNSVWGVPADLIIGNFYINDKPLKGEIRKTGANNTIWVKPLSIVGGFLVGAGFCFMFIRGGHAKIKPDERFNVYF